MEKESEKEGWMVSNIMMRGETADEGSHPMLVEVKHNVGHIETEHICDQTVSANGSR